MYLIASKADSGANQDILNASVEYSLRVLSKLTNKPLYSEENHWVMKVPDKLGNMDYVRQFYKYEPMYIRSYNDMPTAEHGAEFYLTIGPKESVGFGLVERVLNEHRVKYSLIKEKSI